MKTENNIEKIILVEVFFEAKAIVKKDMYIKEIINSIFVELYTE